MSDVAQKLAAIESKLQITKIVSTRSVKAVRGDHHAGFAATYSSRQDEAAGVSKDLLEPLLGEESSSLDKMTFSESRVAYYMLAMQSDLCAYASAWANGNLETADYHEIVKSVRYRYGDLIRQELTSENS